jgi:hypothetical protein
MLRNALLSVMILVMGKCYAQQDYFVLIQAENNQAFYVKIGGKSLSSNIKGRIILSQLKGGNQSITIGFPKQIFPEQQYTFNIEKDLEFELKDLGERGWGLFNPQTLELKMAEKKDASTAGAYSEGLKKDDAFSRLMAGVVGDTAVMYNTYAVEEVKDSPAVKQAVQKDVGMPVADTVLTDQVRKDNMPIDTTVAIASVPVIPHTVVVLPARTGGGTVVKLSERKTPKGLRIAFADRPKGRKADTVIIIIPMDTASFVAAAIKKQDTSEVAVRKPEPALPVATVTEPLFRSKSDSIAAGTVETGQSKADTSIAHATDSIVRTDPNTIHVYINSGKKPARSQTDSSQVGISGKVKMDSGQVAAAKEGGKKPDSVLASTGNVETRAAVISGKETKARLDSVHNAAGRAEPRRELYRPKPDSAQKAAISRPVVVNSDCRNFASDYDVDKLRVRMLEISKDDDKILTAKKIFKTKCFTTRQIKALSEVFASDGSKFRFFEAAYPFVSDDRFRDLTDLLTDPVYNGKFRVMTGQQ